jgi:hypothetical protein
MVHVFSDDFSDLTKKLKKNKEPVVSVKSLSVPIENLDRQASVKADSGDAVNDEQLVIGDNETRLASNEVVTSNDNLPTNVDDGKMIDG